MEKTLDNIEKSRNTQAQLSWDETRAQAIDGLSVAPHRLVEMRPVFSTRQAVTRFLEIYDYWNLIRDIPGNICDTFPASPERRPAAATGL